MHRPILIIVLLMDNNYFQVNFVGWSASGVLASASDDGVVILWDLRVKRETAVLEGHTDHIQHTAVHPPPCGEHEGLGLGLGLGLSWCCDDA